MAPILWQRGAHGQVIDYCLGDILRTKKLIELALAVRLRDVASGRVQRNLDVSQLKLHAGD